MGEPDANKPDTSEFQPKLVNEGPEGDAGVIEGDPEVVSLDCEADQQELPNSRMPDDQVQGTIKKVRMVDDSSVTHCPQIQGTSQVRMVDDSNKARCPQIQELPNSRMPDDQVQAAQHVSDDYLERVEETMNRVPVPKYGDSELEQLPTIYTVPSELRSANVKAYLPVAIQIGPLVHNRGSIDRDYQLLQDYKWCCVRSLISRHHLLQEPSQTRTLLRQCLEALKSLEPRIRASYPRNIDLEPIIRASRFDIVNPDLVLNMLLDGCFILHRLLKYARIARREATASASASATAEGGNDDDDWTQEFGRCWVWEFVTCDLLLLENQIPFFVVEQLFEQIRTDPNESSDVLVAGALHLFRSLQPQMLHASPIPCRDVHHLLHLFYLSVGKPAPAHGDPRQHVHPLSEFPQWVPCAMELEKAGVKFRARQGATSFLDVEFHGGVLEIPMLQLYDYSEPLLRNLIAFEQTYSSMQGNVTAYAIFMDCLVASPEDMRLLQLSGVLVNQMSCERDREEAGFFGRLCHEAHLAANRNYLAGVITEVNKYQQARWPRWRAALVRNYFSSPWVATSLAAAVFLLALTILQSFFAAYGYFKPHKQQ